MATCPECGKAMVKTESPKRAGFFVLKHENADDQKNCGVKFIPVGGKGDKAKAGASAQDYSKAVQQSKKANSSGSGGGSSSGSSGGSGDSGSSGGGEHSGQGKEPVQRN